MRCLTSWIKHLDTLTSIDIEYIENEKESDRAKYKSKRKIKTKYTNRRQ